MQVWADLGHRIAPPASHLETSSAPLGSDGVDRGRRLRRRGCVQIILPRNVGDGRQLLVQQRFDVFDEAKRRCAVAVSRAGLAAPRDQEESEVPVDRIGRPLRCGGAPQTEPPEDRVRVRTVDFDLLHDWKAERVLLGNGAFNRLGTLWLLAQELIAGEGEDPQTALGKLGVQCLQLRVPARGLASEGRDVDHQADVSKIFRE